MDAFGHPELLVMRKVSAVDVPKDFHVLMPRFCEMEQVEHGLNALTELMVHEERVSQVIHWVIVMSEKNSGSFVFNLL